MRVIYRIVAGVAAVLIAMTGVVVFLVTRHDRPVHPVAASVPSASGDTASGSPSPTPSPGLSPLQAALADPRVPELPAVRRLADLPGRPVKVKKWINDERSGIAVARLLGTWKTARPSPFATRQVLPPAKDAGHRALLVSCPVPILVQRKLRDTAVIAARWTLNHQPGSATIRWVASQPLTVGRQDGWLLAYQVKYPLGGKNRSSMAAVVLVEVPGSKPAMLFVSIPDTQKIRWRDINTVVSALRVV
jgi:hypothetical protein